MFNSLRSRLFLNISIIIILLFAIIIYLYNILFIFFENTLIEFSYNIIDSYFSVLSGDNYVKDEEKKFRPFHMIRIDKDKKIFFYNEKTNPYLKIKEACSVVGNQDAICIDEFIKKSTNYNEHVLIISDKISDGNLVKGQESEVRTKIIKNNEDEYYISVIYQKSVVREFGNLILIIVCIATLLLLIIIFLLLLFRISIITNPLSSFSIQLERLSDFDFTKGNIDELKDSLPVSEKNEIGRFAQAFALMIDKLTKNIKQLIETTSIAERMQSELDIAKNIQIHSLPNNFSFPPEKKIELHAAMLPAREVGGDLYDFFWIDENHLCIAIGDVSEKGVPAALMMTVAKKLISSTVIKKGRLQSPVEIIQYINSIICCDNPDSYFVTLFFGILDITTRELRYVNCGHVAPLVTNCDNTPFFMKEVSGPPVGAISGIRYKEILTVLPPSAAIFLCTDGVTEAMNEEDHLFGDKRLLENFSRMQDKSCKEVIDGILNEVRAHAGKATQSDDIAMLMVKFL